MANTRPTAAEMAALLKNDNRTAFASPIPPATGSAAPTQVYVGSSADDFMTIGPTGATMADAADATTGAQAYATGALGPSGPDGIRIAIDIGPTNATGGQNPVTKYVRTEWFFHGNAQKGPQTYDASKPALGAKLHYVDALGNPLKADGTPAKKDLSDAADATTTALTDIGGAVTNYAQPGPLPGDYDVDPRQVGYAPYLGWTVQKP